MNHRPAKHSVAFRVFAVTWLFVWLMAQTLCVHHCASFTFAKTGGSECCAKRASDSSKAPTGTTSIPCGGLKSAKLESNPSLLSGAAAMLPPASPVVVFTLPIAPTTLSLLNIFAVFPERILCSFLKCPWVLRFGATPHPRGPDRLAARFHISFCSRR